MSISNHKRKLLLLGLVGFFSFTAYAANTVVSDSAHATYLIQDYLQSHPLEIKAIQQTQEDTVTELNQLQQLSQKDLLEKVASQIPKQASLPAIYPVRSKRFTPGQVKLRAIQVLLPKPIFIVGDDLFSKKWMHRYQKCLAQLHAKGFVVNVATQKDMMALRQQFPQLSLMPMPGNALAAWLKLIHYPVLISDKLIEQ